MIRTVLFTTDVSGFQLIPEENLILVVFPENRMSTEKVKAVREICKDKNIPCVIHFSPKTQEKIRESYKSGILLDPLETFLPLYEPDYIVSWLYSQIIPMSILSMAEKGNCNFHGGLPGAHGLRRTLEDGLRELPIFWHVMTDVVDGGLKLAFDIININGYNFETARALMIEIGIEMFKRICKDEK